MLSLLSLDTLYVNACITYASLSAGYYFLSRRDTLCYRSAPWRRVLFGLIAGLVSLHLTVNKLYITQEAYYSFEFVPILLVTFIAGWLPGVLALLINVTFTGGIVLDNIVLSLMLLPMLVARVWRYNRLSPFLIVISLLTLFRLLVASPALNERQMQLEGLIYQIISFLCLLICYQALSAMRRHLSTFFSAQDSARHDALTRLHNRHALSKHLSELEQSGTPCCLVMLDIDNFKQLNDIHGHLAGDKVLREVAFLLREANDGGDFIARYGGEEFTIVRNDNRIADCVRHCEYLRKRIAAHPFRLPNGSTIVVTLSFGIAYHSGQAPMVAAFRRADAALYRAKELGKNRVVRS
ncbi:GGDEF domain-containing protein [Enterobacillus tribolii]|uniref:diguanylate cyclase n=1 Tax=Enterobacillus tribolii TaxID=1487935 RepID=A0A370R3B2_9GAMM|nr:GGDEF domain-containing protein [Enterobacillus tribolii]MBW7983965.1 GGDEF domain-containing protein [Enterobacillus tribolii]RDK96903.1 diguanylate cyclase [Enterobacillus tribolii]